MNKDFINQMEYLLGNDINKYLETFNQPNERALNVNTKKIDLLKFEEINKFKIEKIKYDDDAYYLLDDKIVGNSIMHHSGIYYIQDPGALATINSYTFKGCEKVLDLCASPGGKSFQIAKKLNSGFLISNEIDYKRSKVLASNIERLGLDNVIVTNSSANELNKVFKGYFDVILVDAPCSGEGMFRKNEDAINNWSLEYVYECQKRDFEIIDNTIDMLKKGGILIYSTCTYNIHENEEVVKYIANKGFETIKINEILDNYTSNGLIENTKRFYPHISKGEGQFFSVLRKTIDQEEKSPKELKLKNVKIFSDFLKKYTIIDSVDVFSNNDSLYYMPNNIDFGKINVINYGVYLGDIVKNRFEPSHQFFKAFGDKFKIKLDLDISNKDLYNYLRGLELFYEIDNGYGVLMIEGVPLGGFKSVNGVLKNYYPKGLRIQAKEINYE